jgi:nitrite reductase (NADH) small subunit
MSVPIAVGAVDGFPAGTRRTIEVRGREVVVFNIDGEYHAVLNRCPHQAGPVAEGPITNTAKASAGTGWVPEAILNNRVLRCPWHALEFDITTGHAVCNPRWRVRVYETRVQDGIVEVLT